MKESPVVVLTSASSPCESFRPLRRRLCSAIVDVFLIEEASYAKRRRRVRDAEDRRGGRDVKEVNESVCHLSLA